MRIAVIGGGVAGIAAAELLQRAHDVTLYERDPELGGHAHSESVADSRAPGGAVAVDTAFVIFNRGSYPGFRALLARWGLAEVERRAEMSFSFDDRASGRCYALNRGVRAAGLDGVAVIPELLRFRRRAAGDLARRPAELARQTLAQYLRDGGYSRRFTERFLCPTATSVWSVPRERVLEFPALTFLRFMDNHRYLGGTRSGYGWSSMRGGCAQYVRAFERGFRGKVRLGAAVRSVERASTGVEVGLAGGERETYDHVILATHADQALRLLAEPTALERELLGAWTYQRTPTTLHRDASLMPRERRHWASWNIRFGQAQAAVTYYLNLVQGLERARDCFVTLGEVPIDPASVLRRFDYDHPVFDFAAVASQSRLPELHGQGGIHYCGSYFGFGFHEDAIRSAAQVAARLGGERLYPA